MPNLRYTALCDSLPASVPFVGPETQERQRGEPFLARLGANENIFGPSPKAVDAMAAEAAEVWKYGDPENYDLKQALAAHHQIGVENIIIGEGIDGLFGYLVRMFISPGDCVVTSDGAYPTFNYHVAGYGGQIVKVPYKDDHEDPVALIEAATNLNAKLIYLANPDNPMGSWHNKKIMQAMIDAVPDGTLLVLDEAYLEFAPEDTAPDLDINDDRVIRFRTFSKGYGMAGARVGYGIAAAELIKNFDKIRNHFGMCRISQAGALAALADQEYLQQTVENVAAARGRIAEIAAANGLKVVPSATNFVAIDCGQDGDFAKRVLTALTVRGIFVRMPFVAPQDRCIRLSCGPDEELMKFARALPAALDEARNG